MLYDQLKPLALLINYGFDYTILGGIFKTMGLSQLRNIYQAEGMTRKNAKI